MNVKRSEVTVEGDAGIPERYFCTVFNYSPVARRTYIFIRINKQREALCETGSPVITDCGILCSPTLPHI